LCQYKEHLICVYAITKQMLARKHDAELKRERVLRAHALKASKGDNATSADNAEDLKRQLASSVIFIVIVPDLTTFKERFCSCSCTLRFSQAKEVQQLRSKAAHLESRLNGAIVQAQIECEVLLKSRELHWRHTYNELQEQVRMNPVVLQLRERESDLTEQLVVLERRYKAEVGALKRRSLEQGRLNDALRKALEEERR